MDEKQKKKNLFKKPSSWIIIILFLLLIISISRNGSGNSKQNSNSVDTVNLNVVTTTNQNDNLFFVERVIDGDTIELSNGQKVRYIGIETPELVHPSKPVECFAQEASDVNKTLVEGKEVRLEKDISETDKYGRLLRYVYVDDVFVNDYLIRNGYAYAASYPPDVKYQNQFQEAQQEAMANKSGLWSSCEQDTNTNVNSNLIIPPVTPPVSQPAPAPITNYICSYNAYNCDDFATHAEAQAVFEDCGGVSNDVHGLDRDKDGLACEMLP